MEKNKKTLGLVKVPNGSTFYIQDVVTMPEYARSIHCIVTLSPTGNCQLSTIGYANNLARCRDENKRLEILGLLGGYVSAMVLVDIKDNHVEEITNILKKENLVFSTPYISTNGSSMTIMLFRSAALYDYAKQYNKKFQ